MAIVSLIEAGRSRGFEGDAFEVTAGTDFNYQLF
jgi:hypothetical protein